MKNPVDVHIGQRLRHRRWLAGMTQQNLAEAVGIRFQQIQKYESGANRISAARLWILANALGVPVSYFYGGMHDQRVPEENGQEGPLDSKETFEFLRAYYGMPEPARRRLLALTHALSVEAPVGPSHEMRLSIDG
jgi:transcriptional regulator with XRE-family HTH domain